MHELMNNNVYHKIYEKRAIVIKIRRYNHQGLAQNHDADKRF